MAESYTARDLICLIDFHGDVAEARRGAAGLEYPGAVCARARARVHGRVPASACVCVRAGVGAGG